MPADTAVAIVPESDTFACHLSDIHGRMAVRAFAYSIAAEEPALAKALLAIVGREG